MHGDGEEFETRIGIGTTDMKIPKLLDPRAYSRWLALELDLYYLRRTRLQQIDGLDLMKFPECTVLVRNAEEALRIYHDIFKQKEYWFRSSIDTPYLLDCGAHIGLATISFKRLYPQAHVTAIEANPKNF